MFFEKNKYYVFVKMKNKNYDYYVDDDIYYRKRKIILLNDFDNFDESCDYIVDHYNDVFNDPESIDDYAICYFKKENELITLSDIKSKLEKGDNINE